MVTAIVAARVTRMSSVLYCADVTRMSYLILMPASAWVGLSCVYSCLHRMRKWCRGSFQCVPRTICRHLDARILIRQAPWNSEACVRCPTSATCRLLSGACDRNPLAPRIVSESTEKALERAAGRAQLRAIAGAADRGSEIERVFIQLDAALVGPCRSNRLRRGT